GGLAGHASRLGDEGVEEAGTGTGSGTGTGADALLPHSRSRSRSRSRLLSDDLSIASGPANTIPPEAAHSPSSLQTLGRGASCPGFPQSWSSALSFGLAVRNPLPSRSGSATWRR